MKLETIKKEIISFLEGLKKEKKEHGLTFYNIHGLTDKENIHSKFITFLLNPKGRHGCGNNFLKLFIEILNDKIKSENLKLSSLILDDYNQAKAETGSVINKKQISGGRVDVRVFNTDTGRNKNIIIENKINAIDQWAQLARYRSDYPNSTIVYLTPLGKPASSYSLHSENEEKNLEEKDYIKLSYINDIGKWLCQCLNYLQNNNCEQNEKTKNKVSVLLNDYLMVINELTYNERRKNTVLPKLCMDLDTVKYVFENPGDINKITEWKDTIFHLKEYLIKEKFINIILNKLVDTIGDGLLYKINEGKGIMKKGWGFQFYKTKWKEYNVKIGFYFRKKNLQDCTFGLRKYEPNNPKIPEYFDLQVKDKKTKSVWYCLDKENKLGEYSNWYRKTFYDFISDTIEETPFYKLVKTIVEEKCKQIDDVIIKK
jgi:hypothetical protein